MLELLVRQLRHQGIRRIVMCTGYLADQIEQEFRDGTQLGVSIEYSKEPEPLGTGGAIKFAEHLLRNASEFLIMNGDSFLDMDFQELLRSHRERGGLITIAIRRAENAARFGTVQVDERGRVTRFAEKMGVSSPGLISAGIYVFSPQVMKYISEGPASLEKDVFPRLLEYGVFACEQRGMFFDIGTAEDYTRAQQLCEKALAAAVRSR